ncbi:hypothetical protein N8I77_001743 [Diaporthe amygdali]|uniref:Uncharacterized protein n=1 Tax=Phomopsis amygdali TaxID=1214568 RepID=A0AAD9WAH5_PHOAM|nr:hypothetical protein N8I77_001743 [Diaporthe amygdali]
MDTGCGELDPYVGHAGAVVFASSQLPILHLRNHESGAEAAVDQHRRVWRSRLEVKAMLTLDGHCLGRARTGQGRASQRRCHCEPTERCTATVQGASVGMSHKPEAQSVQQIDTAAIEPSSPSDKHSQRASGAVACVHDTSTHSGRYCATALPEAQSPLSGRVKKKMKKKKKKKKNRKRGGGAGRMADVRSFAVE